MVEFEDSFSERMAQLEQEDLERYQRDILRNSSNLYADENPSYDDEFQSKLSVLLDMVRGCINDLQRTPSSTGNGSEPHAVNIQPVSFINDVAIGNHSDFGSETTDEHPDEVIVVNDLPDSAEMTNLSGIQGKSGNDSSNSEEMVDLEETVVSESAIIFQFSVNPSFHKQLTIMDSDLNSEKFFVTKQSWIDSEVHRNKNNGSIYEEISEQKEAAAVVLQVFDEMPKITLVDPNEESSACKGSMPLFDYVPFILDSTIGLRYEEVRVVACHSFDPGGAYLSPTAFHDTLYNKYAQNDKSSVPEIYVEEQVEGFEQQSPLNLEGLEVTDKLPSPPSIGIFEKYIEARDSGSNSDCYSAVIDQIKLKEGTTLLLDTLFERILVELPLNTLSLNHLGSHENGERCVGECKDDVVFTDDALFLFDPGGSSVYYRDGDPFVINQEQGDCCYTITVDDASVRFENDALGVYGGFEIVVEYESMLIWDDHSDTGELVLMVHDICIPRTLVYASDEKMQASATIISYHKWNINGILLVVTAASSVPSSCVAWHNTYVITPITPSVFCAKVVQQLMFSIKAYSIPALLKDWDSLQKMVDRVVIIQGKKGLKGTELLSGSDGEFLVDNIVENLYLLTFWCANPLTSLSMSTKCLVSSSHSFQLGEQALFIVISGLILRSFYVVLDGHGVAKTYEKNNVAGIAFGILEYFTDTTMIFVLALLAGLVWDPGQDVNSFYIIEDNDVLKSKGIWIQLACGMKQDDVKLSMLAMQMAQMLQLVEYGGYPYDHGSYTIIASENTCHSNFYASSNGAYTNVFQGDENGEVQNRAALGTSLQIRNEDSCGCCVLVNLKEFVWDPGLQMSMEVESDNQHLGFWIGEKLPCVCTTSALVLALFPVSFDSYSMGNTISKCRDKLPLCCYLVSFSVFQELCCVICCHILMLWLVGALAYTNTMTVLYQKAVWDHGVRISTTLRTRRFLRGRSCHE